MDNHWAQVPTSLFLDESRAKLRGHVLDARFVEPRLDALPNRFRRPGNSESRETRLRVFGRLHFHGAHSFGQRFSDFLCVARGPHARAVDASAAAVKKHTVHHHIDVLLPIVDHVVTEQDLGESRSVNLNTSVATIAFYRRRAS